MIAVLAGGVGAARFLAGLVRVVEPEELCVIVNTGDDTVMHGLHVSPDLDTVTYTLAGLANPTTGWGLDGDTFVTMAALERLGARAWFRLGDRDLATHLLRTGALARGERLSEVTGSLCSALRIRVKVLPMSDDPVRTVIELADGPRVEFQDYFVRLRHEVAIRAVHFEGIEEARPAPGVLEALGAASIVVLAPSNPIVSIGPILALSGVGEVLASRRDSVVAISPIVAGAALKGPAARMLAELGHEQSALGVARLWSGVAGSLLVDEADESLVEAIRAEGLRCVATDTIMRDALAAAELARAALDFAAEAALER